MLKVFLVEDESVIREGLRDKIPWEQYGYKFVGEAADGEMALPLIRKLKPDVLITDIKMPFMDGLSLSKIVHAEFPKTKIIIISGYDDFEYAQQAIALGVDQYLLKPITKITLKKVLLELKEKIESDMEQNDYQTQFADEMHEYEQFSRRRFFERLLEGEMAVKDIYDEASKLSIEMDGSCYNLMFFYLQQRKMDANHVEMELFSRKQDEILHYFLRFPQYVLFGWNVNCYGVLIKGEEGQMEEILERGITHIQKICESESAHMEWYIACGNMVNRLSALPECYGHVNHYMAYRFIVPELHILNEDTLRNDLERKEEQNISNVDPSKMDPDIIRDFLNRGQENEIIDFVGSYLLGVQEALQSNMFRDYVVLNIRFTIMAYVQKLGATIEEYEALLEEKRRDIHLSAEQVPDYFIDMLAAAMKLRNKESDYQSGKVLRHAISYIDGHYMEEGLSLNAVAEVVSVSANYLSATFSQGMQKTFIEYVTSKRMEKAKKLLKTTDKSLGEIAQEIGYKDPPYFSFVFKKTQGISPREYRTKSF